MSLVLVVDKGGMPKDWVNFGDVHVGLGFEKSEKVEIKKLDSFNFENVSDKMKSCLFDIYFEIKKS